MLLFAATAVQSATLELVRGAPIGTPGYWAVEDAYLDKAEPGQDHGGGFTVLGGEGQTILIRFGDLARVVGPNRRVTAATLVLTPSGGESPNLSGVTAVADAWGEGPTSSLARIITVIETDPNKLKKPGEAPRGAATWTQRRMDIAPWATPGIPGGTAIDATGTLNEKTYAIAGLGPTVQKWLAQPWTNHGLALRFGNGVEFFSSQAPSGRPRLVLTTEPIAQIDVTRPDLAVVAIAKTDGKWTARVKNLGSAPSPAGKATWWTDGKAGTETDVKPLAPNEEVAIAYAGSEPKEDLQVPNLGLAVAAKGDAESANDRLDVFTTGKAVTLRVKAPLDPQAVVNYWNETVAPQSRFSFAPEGVRGRVRLEAAISAEDGAATLAEGLRQIGRSLGLPEPAPTGVSEDLYPGLMGYGDTRFDGTIPSRLALPYEPYPNPPTETSLLEPTGLLASSDVGRLNDPGKPLPMPRIAIVQVTDLAGRALSNLRLTVEQPGAAASILTTGSTGTLTIPTATLNGFKPDLSNGTLTLRGVLNGASAAATIKAWRISDAFRRANSPAVIMETRLDLPMLPLETETNLAREKPVRDSANDEPAKLAAATDGSETTAAPLPTAAGGWVEIDLGRDRTLGEIAIKPGASFWDRYEIRVYATGQKREDASVWASELNGSWARRNRGQDGWVAYRMPAQRVRFVQIVSKDGGPASLADVRVVPVKLANGGT